MITKENLQKETESFFNHYWNKINGTKPVWSEPWEFDGTIPNNDKRGCYALFNNDEVIYIGVGLGKSFGTYHGSGLGDRLKRYWKVNKANTGKQYEPTDDWLEVTSIITIGFIEQHYPLAAALEIYLISKLIPARNLQHK